MAINAENKKKGFTLLIAIIFMSVMLSLGLALSSLGYKQAVLASSAVESQYAFYAADAGLECVLYTDQQQNLFAYANHASPGSVSCDGSAATIGSGPSGPQCFNTAACKNEWVTSTRLSLDGGARCADVTVYKPSGAGATYLFSQGYDVSCAQVGTAGTRYNARGIEAHY
ncbi:MAG: hypothetical protein B7W98_03350 [Parcubacteria group bacterium 20-58-5]|nr:MAG: hypothetical protein B7W98_03350 [Parcubacteria group bacterium 20-58-5]